MTHTTTNHAFSLIELVITVVIIATIATIAVPKFSHADTGRKLQQAQKLFESEIQNAKLRARSTQTTHVFNVNEETNTLIIWEGTTINSDNIVSTTNFNTDPVKVQIRRSSLGNEYAVITPFGDLTPTVNIEFFKNSDAKILTLNGKASINNPPVITDN